LTTPETTPDARRSDRKDHYPEERTLDRVPTFEADAGLTRKTRKAIDVFLKTSRAQLWIQHDFSASAALKKGPAFYD